jgi:hypothetical protein
LQVLDVKLPFDEAALLLTNKPYLLRSLGLQELTVSNVAEPAAEAAKATGTDLSAAAPGQPVIHFSAAAAAEAPVPVAAVASS